VMAPAVVRRTREGRPRTDRWDERCASGQYDAGDAPACGAARTPARRGARDGLGKPRSLRRRTGAASRRDVAAQSAASPFCFLSLRLNMNNSKNLNRSVQNFEYKNCRSHYPLQLSQRP
jgi:hypothetical protein